MAIVYVSIEVQAHGLKVEDASYLDWLEGWLQEATREALQTQPELGHGLAPRGELLGDVSVEVTEVAGEAGKTTIDRTNEGRDEYRKVRSSR